MTQLSDSQSICDLLRQQRSFFNTGQTKAIAFRIDQLKRLKQAILDSQAAILEALKADLGKPAFEAYVAEVGTIREINYVLKHIKSWVKPKRVAVPFEQWPSSARIYPEPLGVVLIISPWNYPVQLALMPLVGAIAAGNCAIVKPSEVAPHASQAIAQIISKTFPPSYIAVVEGGVETSQQLLAEKFDHIFFTGGTQVGVQVMVAAAQHLTPVTLELGGKSPCIVDSDIEIKKAAQRITWGKYLNAGQSCIAPDYLLVDKTIKQALITAIRDCIQNFYGSDPAQSPDFARIVSPKHYQRLTQLLTGDIVIGGQVNPEELYIAPTVIKNASPDDRLLQEEIFGPILPVIEYDDLSEAIAIVNKKPKPLALYFFSRNRAKQLQILQETSSGSVCLNHTMMQFGVSSLPFGGVGNSGIGAYHGQASFNTFSHDKSVLNKSWWEFFSLFPPYKGKLGLVKKLIG